MKSYQVTVCLQGRIWNPPEFVLRFRVHGLQRVDAPPLRNYQYAEVPYQ